MDPAPHTVEIEFLYLDLSSCGPCVAGDASLQAAAVLLCRVLAEVGVTLNLRKVHVTSAQQAGELRLVSSPTIRVDGADIAGELAESQCGDCTGLSAGAGPVACRVWPWRGQQFPEAPMGLIIDAVLRHLYSQTPALPLQKGYDGLPDNLAGFFGTATDPGLT